MERVKYTSKFVPCTCITQLNHTGMILGLNRGLEMLKRQKLVRLHKFALRKLTESISEV